MTPEVDQRIHPRLDAVLPARFMLSDGSEHGSATRNVSAGGCALDCVKEPELGDTVVAYVGEVGRMAGPVVRVSDGSFAVAHQGSPRQRERIADRLMWVANRETLEADEDRLFRRVMGGIDTMSLMLPDGTTQRARILDLSLGGAAISAAVVPTVGTEVYVGQSRAKVIRHIEEGFAVQFLDVPQAGHELVDHLS